MAEKELDQAFVEYVVKAIVDNPEDVSTERSIDEMGTLISLHVHADDMGTIIGKDGRTAKALRILLRVLGAKHNARVNLKIIEPEGGRGFFPNKVEENQVEAAEETQPNHVSEALKDLPQDDLF